MASLEDTARAAITPTFGIYVGAYFGAMIVDTFLAGIALGLVSHFFTLSIGESRIVKLAVTVSTTMSMVISAYTWAATADTFVTNFGQYGPFISVKWRTWYGLLDPISVVPVQLFFAHRAYKLSKNNRALGLLMVSFVFLSFVGNILYVPMSWRRGYQFVTAGRTGLRVALYMGSAASVIADVLITSTILYYLSRTKRDWHDTDTLVKRLIAVSTETQLPPAVMSIVIILLVTLEPNSYLAYFFQRLQAKLYVVGFLWALNSRMNLRAFAVNESGGRLAKTFGINPNQPAIIQVNTETYIQADKENDHERSVHTSEPKAAIFRSRGPPTMPTMPTYRQSSVATAAGNAHTNESYELSPRDHAYANGEKKSDLELQVDFEGVLEDEEKLEYYDNSSRTGLTRKDDENDS